jgi:hypothetical protein
MNSRKRLQYTLDHKQPDKIPIDFGGTPCTGMHVTCVADLRNYYQLDKRPVKIFEPFQMLGLIEDDLKEAIGVDVTSVISQNTCFGFPNENWKEYRLDNGLEVLVPQLFNTTKDGKGNTYIYPQGDTTAPASGKMPKGGYYFDCLIRQEEIDEDHLNPEDNLQEYGPISDDQLAYFKAEAEKASDSGFGVVSKFGGMGLGDVANIPGPALKFPKGIRDVAEWYITIAARQDYVHSIFEKQTDIAVENLKKLNRVVGDLVDVAFICGSDFGTQTGTLYSAKTFESLFMPYYKKVNGWIHKNTGWKTFKHCCGAIDSFIPLFIESGFDILNPVQCSATGMDPAKLKAKYGRDIVFWGGGVDTQYTLPFDTPDEVRRQVLERCGVFSKDGGFVFNSIHNVQAKTPIENIVAMINAVHEFNGDN